MVKDVPVINIDNAAFQHDAQAQFDAELHIDAVFSIDKYVTPNGTNTLIEGIRGTGKTHMLKMISTRIIERFSDIRVLPVYISLAEVSEYVTKDPALFRVHFYSTLIIRTIETIKNNRQQIEFKEDNVLLQLTKQFAMLFGFFEEDNFDTLLDKIESYAEGLQREILTNPTKISEITKSVEECAAGVKSPGIQVDAKRNDETSHSLEYITIKLAHLNASQFMTEFFKYLHSVLRLRHTMLLVDECSDLPQEGQIEVFRLFKLIRGGTRIDNSRNFLYFIGGVYPPQATCYPSKALGSSFDFEPGDDCAVEYLELDVQLDFYEEFFKNLLLAKLRKFHKNQYSNIGDIFEDDRSFLLATYASHGLPRRFFEILHQSYENLIEFAASRPIQDNRVYKIRY
ncbi:MAG: ATP-binding protein, partial [Bacillota bacterium]